MSTKPTVWNARRGEPPSSIWLSLGMAAEGGPEHAVVALVGVVPAVRTLRNRLHRLGMPKIQPPYVEHRGCAVLLLGLWPKPEQAKSILHQFYTTGHDGPREWEQVIRQKVVTDRERVVPATVPMEFADIVIDLYREQCRSVL